MIHDFSIIKNNGAHPLYMVYTFSSKVGGGSIYKIKMHPSPKI